MEEFRSVYRQGAMILKGFDVMKCLTFLTQVALVAFDMASCSAKYWEKPEDGLVGRTLEWQFGGKRGRLRY